MQICAPSVVTVTVSPHFTSRSMIRYRFVTFTLYPFFPIIVVQFLIYFISILANRTRNPSGFFTTILISCIWINHFSIQMIIFAVQPVLLPDVQSARGTANRKHTSDRHHGRMQSRTDRRRAHRKCSS